MTPWGRAILALQLVEIDPDGLGGICLHARSGPVRDAFLARLPANATRLHPAMPHDALVGGVDVSASLTEGTLVHQSGLLEGSSGPFIIAMAERLPILMATTIASTLDRKTGSTFIALDEHSEDEAPPPAPLTDRLAFHVSLEGVSLSDIETLDDTPATTPTTITPQQVLDDLVSLAVSLGITSLRAPLFALNAARAHATLHGRTFVTQDDVLAAAELVLAPRATRMPQDPAEAEAEDQPEQEAQGETKEQTLENLPEDLLLAAIETALPPDLLTKVGARSSSTASGSGAGKKRIGNRRGRPLPARDTGARIGEARIDLLATLRAALPWQKLRQPAQPDRTGPLVYPPDLRYKRYQDLSDRLLIFCVDASGSAALARLAEAKGAVELLLAEAYARRDHVALISFRGQDAEVLLPPTRSLVQTKRRLAELPGGGGTPLASGLKAGLDTALQAERRGLSPVIILLTDGRSNVALDGSADRAQAAQDASHIACQVAHARIDSIVIDTGKRPEAALKNLAASLQGQYVSLPRADALALSRTISTALDG